MNKNYLFSVIIPTYHRNDLLAKCLDCLAPGVQTLSANQYEVIVTDDGSETTAEAMIQQHYPWAKWVAGPRKGPAANRNNGANNAQGEWLAFTDDDCLPDPQWLEAYTKAINSHLSYLVFEGKTYADRPRKSLAEISPVNETGGYLWSCNFAIQKQLFQNIGGFDERFPYAAMEDVELRLRLKKRGYDFSFIESAAICHPWRSKGGWRKLKQHQNSQLIYLSIHPEEMNLMNYRFYIWQIFRRIIKESIPEILQYKGAGIQEEFLEYVGLMRMAYLTWQLDLNAKKV